MLKIDNSTPFAVVTDSLFDSIMSANNYFGWGTPIYSASNGDNSQQKIFYFKDENDSENIDLTEVKAYLNANSGTVYFMIYFVNDTSRYFRYSSSLSTQWIPDSVPRNTINYIRFVPITQSNSKGVDEDEFGDKE